ncbi:sugar ABC transporter ATP-binding protein [Microbacterium aurantiacum]|uniref:sugar ABC transporter ATP-binding protein n=1 Tax=Microbacterium aurantiacum TaxID=162393 RepID=UPI003440EBE3
MSDEESGRAREPALVEAVGLRKQYGAVAALRGVDFSLRSGEVHGLCGHNGAGKSTLVKMLVGLEHPDSGELRVGGEDVVLHGVAGAQRYGIAMLDQELSLVPELTVAENIFLGNVDEKHWIKSVDRSRRARELLDTVGLHDISPDSPVEATSLGERQLIEVARLLGRNARVLILDEPTATLTDAEIALVFRAIRGVVARGAGVIFVSHRLDEVLDICDRVTVMRDGQDVAEEPVDALTKHDLVRLMLGDVQHSEGGGSDSVAVQDIAGGSGAAEGLSVDSLKVGRMEHSVSLNVPPGAIVGLAGQLGSGASDLLSALAGLEAAVSGRIHVGGTPVRLASPAASRDAGIHFVSNDRKAKGLFLTRSIESNLVVTRIAAYAPGGLLQFGRLKRAARRLVGLIGVESRRLPLPVGSLSGGNQQKVFVGRNLGRADLKVLLLDEPTRGVDVGGRADIHRLIRHAASEGAAVLFASTELDEVLDLADVVVTLYSGRIVSIRHRSETDLAEVFRDMTHRQEADVA